MLSRYLKGSITLVMLALLPLAAGERAFSWPEDTPAQLAEDVFGVRFRQMRLMDGNKAALVFLLKELERSPRPVVQAYVAWMCLFSKDWEYPEMHNVERGIKLANEAAEAGSSIGLDVLARAKSLGIGGEVDPAQAQELLAKAMARGAVRSQARLGALRAMGHGSVADIEGGARLAREAAQLGQTFGLIEIGDAYFSGKIGGARDLKTALAYYDEASSYNDGEARGRLRYLKEKGMEEAAFYIALDYVRAANRAAWLAPARVKEHLADLMKLDRGDPRALVEIGRAHTDGVYARTDYKFARECFEKAAAQGNLDAKFLLAKMKLRGWGEKASPAALGEIRALADAGVGEAVYYLGYLHYWGVKEGPGITKDPALAFNYIRRSAQTGHPLGMVNLGFCYEHGIGTPVNYALAAKVYWEAWQLGYVEGRNRVRSMMGFVKMDLQ